jgi:hypothetical protein
VPQYFALPGVPGAVVAALLAGIDGQVRVRSRCRFAPPLIRITPDLLRAPVVLSLKSQCDLTLRLVHRRGLGGALQRERPRWALVRDVLHRA